jgi:hypothetical protein
MSLPDAGSATGHVSAATPVAEVAGERGATRPGGTVREPTVPPAPAGAVRALVPYATTGSSR